MVKLIQRQQSPALRTRLSFPLDDVFWNRFMDDFMFRRTPRVPTEFSADWMPDVDVSERDKEITVEAKAVCKMRNGTLTITLPKKGVKSLESKARKLAIET